MFFAVIINAQNGFNEKNISIKYTSNGEETPANVTRPRMVAEKTAQKTEAAAESANSTFSLEKKAFELINGKRLEKGLQPLKWSDEVAKIARLHSQNMANYKFFSHTGLDGSLVNDRADRLGVSRWRAIGENIAFNRGYQNPVEFAVERWMLSTSHMQNLLNDRWKESGVGVAVANDGSYYFTQVFMVRK